MAYVVGRGHAQVFVETILSAHANKIKRSQLFVFLTAIKQKVGD